VRRWSKGLEEQGLRILSATGPPSGKAQPYITPPSSAAERPLVRCGQSAHSLRGVAKGLVQKKVRWGERCHGGRAGLPAIGAGKFSLRITQGDHEASLLGHDAVYLLAGRSSSLCKARAAHPLKMENARTDFVPTPLLPERSWLAHQDERSGDGAQIREVFESHFVEVLPHPGTAPLCEIRAQRGFTGRRHPRHAQPTQEPIFSTNDAALPGKVIPGIQFTPG
jgi:hypothetical protein